MLYSNPVGNLAQARTLGQLALIAASLWQSTARPKIASSGLITIDHLVNPLVTHPQTADPFHHPGNLFRAPLIFQQVPHPLHQARDALTGFTGRSSSGVTGHLSLIRAVSTLWAVTPQFAANR